MHSDRMSLSPPVCQPGSTLPNVARLLYDKELLGGGAFGVMTFGPRWESYCTMLAYMPAEPTFTTVEAVNSGSLSSRFARDNQLPWTVFWINSAFWSSRMEATLDNP
jgi:hypothetical protein